MSGAWHEREQDKAHKAAAGSMEDLVSQIAAAGVALCTTQRRVSASFADRAFTHSVGMVGCSSQSRLIECLFYMHLSLQQSIEPTLSTYTPLTLHQPGHLLLTLQI